jgi:hypothetical protein
MGSKEQKMNKRVAKQMAQQAAEAAQMVDVVAELPELVPATEQDHRDIEITKLEEAGQTVELVPTEVAPDATPEAPTAPPAGPTLHVKQGLALRGGRGEWYKLLCKYDGKPVAEYIAAGKANPASHYTARSTKCGQPKTPESRLSWFKRAGIVTIS